MKKPLIGIDTRMIANTGIGTYLRGLLDHLSGITDSTYDICLYGKSVYSNYPWKSFTSKIYSAGEQLGYISRLKDCQLWHSPHYNVPLISGKTKWVVTIHDLIHWIFRKEFFNPVQTFYAEKMLGHAVRHSHHIITVSEKTKSDLVQEFDADPEKISVIYEGVSHSFRALENPEKVAYVLNKYRIPKNYFLYVGMIKPHKNVLWLCHLFHKLKQQGKTHSVLVLVGKKDIRSSKDAKELRRLEANGEVIHIPYAESDDLVALYNGAISLVHPSLYEGFGLTLLEAMACETPVIACRSASIPEVAGDAGMLVESCSDSDMANAITHMEKFPDVRAHYVQKGLDQVKKFSWKSMAEQTLEVYEKVLNPL